MENPSTFHSWDYSRVLLKLMESKWNSLIFSHNFWQGPWETAHRLSCWWGTLHQFPLKQLWDGSRTLHGVPEREVFFFLRFFFCKTHFKHTFFSIYIRSLVVVVVVVVVSLNHWPPKRFDVWHQNIFWFSVFFFFPGSKIHQKKRPLNVVRLSLDGWTPSYYYRPSPAGDENSGYDETADDMQLGRFGLSLFHVR